MSTQTSHAAGATETIATAAARRANRTPAFLRWWANSWHPIVFLAIVVAAWWISTESGAVAPYILPSPSDTWAAFEIGRASCRERGWMSWGARPVNRAVAL